MYDNFKIANYNNALVSPEFYAKPLSRLFSGDVIDGLTVIPGTGLQVTLQPGNALLRYGSAAVASARIVSLVADFNLAIPTPDASNPRIDVVVIYVDNAVNLPVVNGSNPPTSANLDGPGVVKAKIVSGTPAATPVAPTSVAIQASVGAGNSYTVSAQVRVDPGVALIAANKITDVRKKALVTSDKIDSATFDTHKKIVFLNFETTGTKTISGLGFRPQSIKTSHWRAGGVNLSSMQSMDGFGVRSGNTQGCSSAVATTAPATVQASTASRFVEAVSSTGAITIAGTITSWGEDSITYNVTAASSGYTPMALITD
ncbi:hypothetical protein KRR55_06015 [Paeniglutamicibacter sp. ABSL32-1]|uniref:hypothetical protein n=1 Tax=Paeniglutamicibacter quisquiliarum TaxID=2849498 RepID=UPI001C2D0F10|nr:hypothetical protein [Paeniglutamicibacter quisquiliarum]MBV1778667.1 hypothetical protein [Paeniglutamicibacter quisquiliarum]